MDPTSALYDAAARIGLSGGATETAGGCGNGPRVGPKFDQGGLQGRRRGQSGPDALDLASDAPRQDPEGGHGDDERHPSGREQQQERQLGLVGRIYGVSQAVEPPVLLELVMELK